MCQPSAHLSVTLQLPDNSTSTINVKPGECANLAPISYSLQPNCILKNVYFLA